MSWQCTCYTTVHNDMYAYYMLNWYTEVHQPDQFQLKQLAQLSQRDHAAGWVTCGQKWKTNANSRSAFNHCDVIGQQSNRIRQKTQNKGYYAAQGHSRSSRSVSNERPYATSYTD